MPSTLKELCLRLINRKMILLKIILNICHNCCTTQNKNISEFYILLTVHLGSILVNNQLDAQFFFRVYTYLFQFSTCFEHPCARHQENQLY